MTWVESIHIFREPVLTVVWMQAPDCLKEYECFKIRENKIILADLFLFLICTMCQALCNVIFLILRNLEALVLSSPFYWLCGLEPFNDMLKFAQLTKLQQWGSNPAVIEYRLLNALHCNRICGRSGGYIIPCSLNNLLLSNLSLILKWQGGWRNDAHAAWKALVSYFGLSVWV